MLSAMSYDSIPGIEGVTMGVNYGFNKIRFVTPVTSGSRVRAHFILASSDTKKASEITNFFDVSVEIEGNDRPALVAEWISRQYFK
jgi:acyl dehydratase